jgi:hypothetical protein
VLRSATLTIGAQQRNCSASAQFPDGYLARWSAARRAGKKSDFS